MEEAIDYKYVYELQDQVLEIVRTVETPFYLTGGTALHRFYYQRILLRGTLQVDFVHDSVYRFGKSVVIDGNKVDNLMNMLANKVTTIMDRDEEKDVFDLFAIATHEPFEWGHILEIANRKAIVDRAFLVERLKTFPLSWLERLKYIRPFQITRQMVDQMVQDILRDGTNTLCGKGR